MRLRSSLLAFACLGGTALAQSSATAPITVTGEAAAAPPRAAPAPTKDLDTLQLASAHRERAASVDEKTNGLWQSWTTSICEGCGDTPPYRTTVRSYYVNGRRSAGVETSPEAARPRAAPRTAAPETSGRSLYTDLSTENIDRIRRMPAR